MTEPRPEDVAAALQHGVAPSSLLDGATPQDGHEPPRHNTPDAVDDGAGSESPVEPEAAARTASEQSHRHAVDGVDRE